MKKVLKKIFKTRKNLYRFLALSGVMIIAIYIFFKVALKPYDVQITSQTSGGFIVSWRTRIPVPGKVYVSDKDNFLPLVGKVGKKVFYDERNDNGFYYNHSVIVAELDNLKNYHFRIGELIYVFQSSDNNQKFNASTTDIREELPVPEPLWGSVVEKEEEESVSDAIITLQIRNDTNEQSNYVSTVTSSEGTWTIDANSFYRDDLSEPFSLKGDISLTMTVKTKSGEEYIYKGILEQFSPTGPLKIDEHLEKVSSNSTSGLVTPIFAKEGTIDGCTCNAGSCGGANSDCCDVLACAPQCITVRKECVNGHWEIQMNGPDPNNTNDDWDCWASAYNQSCVDNWNGGQLPPPGEPPPSGGCERHDILINVHALETKNKTGPKATFTADVALWFGKHEDIRIDANGRQDVSYNIDSSESNWIPKWNDVAANGGWLGISATTTTNFSTDEGWGDVVMNICNDYSIDLYLIKVGGQPTPPPEPPPAEKCENDPGYKNPNNPDGTPSQCIIDGGTCMTKIEFQNLPDKDQWTTVPNKCPGGPKTVLGGECEWVCRMPPIIEPPEKPTGERNIKIQSAWPNPVITTSKGELKQDTKISMTGWYYPLKTDELINCNISGTVGGEYDVMGTIVSTAPEEIREFMKDFIIEKSEFNSKDTALIIKCTIDPHDGIGSLIENTYTVKLQKEDKPSPPQESCYDDPEYHHQDYLDGTPSQCTTDGGTCMTKIEFDELANKNEWTTVPNKCPGGSSTALGQDCEWVCRMPPQAAPPPDEPPPSDPTPLGLHPPLKNKFAMTSPFGCRFHPVDGEFKLHEGIDVAASAGTQVYPVAPGEVVLLGSNCGGTFISLYHPQEGIYSAYIHLDDSSVSVSMGSIITDTNKPIGEVKDNSGGNCDKATGTHFHFELSYEKEGRFLNVCNFPEVRIWSSGCNKTTTPKELSRGDCDLAKPLSNNPCTSCCFGCDESDPFYPCEGVNNHNGIDKSSKAGDPISSIADGEVTDIFTWPEPPADDAGCGGQYVRVWHSKIEMYAEYYHLDDNLQVSSGQQISRGQLIGYIKEVKPGTCSWSGGTHFHFSLSRDKESDYINPCALNTDLGICTKRCPYSNPEKNAKIKKWECNSKLEYACISSASLIPTVSGNVSTSSATASSGNIVPNVQAKNSSPVNGAKILFHFPGNEYPETFQVETDENGYFSVDLPSNLYEIEVKREGYKTLKETLLVEQGQSYNLQLILDTGDQQEYGGFSGIEDISVVHSLKKGWNLITLNAVPEKEDYLASDLIDDINKHDDVLVSRIMKFRNGYWQIYRISSNDNNFRLNLGEGYVLKAEKSTDFSISGKKANKPVPIKLSTGWNLVGIPYSEDSYTAISLIDSVNNTGGQLDTVTKWESQWVTVIKDEGLVYGHDFKINNQSGYFVRSRNLVYWTP
ncbi:MAG: peptidoglycan DD-metalloendopeptidase family protein [Candidatus Dojkabacteria bacterium]|nr:peptidoglycan DD-metalloendopeptidase family protein [Candidatus Dojkabacteria bacterium]